jgi:hypothetical protein
MAIANYFYNATTKKYVALFGTIFNQIKIERKDNAGNLVQTMIVPLSYAPFQKVLSKLVQEPDLINGTRAADAISLPRMSFEITNMQYDSQRKLASSLKMRKESKAETNSARNFVYAATPYNLDFSLYIMTKYSEDATKILEQILPFFTPDWTVSAFLIPDLDSFDLPIILNSVTTEDLYEGDYIERQTILYTLNFTLKGYFFGPEKTKKVIKFVDAGFATSTLANAPLEEDVNVYPVILANNSIGWSDIEFDDNWVANTDYVNPNGANQPFVLDIVYSNTDLSSTSNNVIIDLESGYAIDDLNLPQT